eukprot:Skav234135  [mRNA]  locus=scaffold753:301549:311126:- [translate_table: standard]
MHACEQLGYDIARICVAGVFLILIIGLLIPMWIYDWYCYWVLCCFVAGGWRGSLEFWIAVCTSMKTVDQEYLQMLGLFLAWCLPTCAALQCYQRLIGHKRLVEPQECLLIQLVVGDTAQMVVGRSIGQHFVCPQLSPKKTLEGTWSNVPRKSTMKHSGSKSWYLIIGCIGDLYFSAVKRRLGIKDYSRILSSHGGLLDRIDSFMFAANALVWKATYFAVSGFCKHVKTIFRSYPQLAPSLPKRFERLSLRKVEYAGNAACTLVFALEHVRNATWKGLCWGPPCGSLSLGPRSEVGKDPCTKWPPFAESVGAVVYHCDPQEQESRRFKAMSEYFDAHLHMHYLLRMEQSGVQDYLVLRLKVCEGDWNQFCSAKCESSVDAKDYYLPQLSQVALLRYNKSSLHRFLLDKAAAQSMPFALKIHWLVRSIVEERWKLRTPELYENAMAMLNLCEAAMVNSSSSSRKREDEASKNVVSPGPPQVHRILRSSSDPDLQSNRAPSVEESSKQRGNAPKRRSRTPFASKVQTGRKWKELDAGRYSSVCRTNQLS